MDYEIQMMQVAYPFLSLFKKKIALIGRKEELDLLHESLHKSRMKNVILIGEAGTGKTAIIEKFANEIKDNYYVLQLDLTGMVAGTSLRGEFEEKVFNCLNDINDFNAKYPKKIILFIDEIHMMYTMGQCRESDSATLGNMVKPYLSNGSITIIGATTNDEYRQTILQDKALKRRLSPIFIKEMSKEEVLKILEKFCKRKVEKQLLEFIYEESLKLDISNPDASIEILDRCLARKEFKNTEIDKKMIENIVRYMEGE